MVKNKALPDSAAHPSLVSFFLSLSLSLEAVHPEGTPGSPGARPQHLPQTIRIQLAVIFPMYLQVKGQ